MNSLLLLAALQASGWVVSPQTATVGDTVWLTRRLAMPAGIEAQVSPLGDAANVESLVPPKWWYTEGTLVVQYTVALFATGTQAVAIPDAELLYPDGRVEALVGDTAWVNVVSVLPEGSPPHPAPSLAPIVRTRTRPQPVVGLVGGVAVALLLWGLARRRTRSRPAPDQVVLDHPEPPVDRWLAAGETRAVAAVTADRLRHHIAQRLDSAGRHLDTEECIAALESADDDLPVRALAQVLRSLERASFAPAAPLDVVEAVTRAEELGEALKEVGEDGQGGEVSNVGGAVGGRPTPGTHPPAPRKRRGGRPAP